MSWPTLRALWSTLCAPKSWTILLRLSAALDNAIDGVRVAGLSRVRLARYQRSTRSDTRGIHSREAGGRNYGGSARIK